MCGDVEEQIPGRYSRFRFIAMRHFGQRYDNQARGESATLARLITEYVRPRRDGCYTRKAKTHALPIRGIITLLYALLSILNCTNIELRARKCKIHENIDNWLSKLINFKYSAR